MINIDQYSSGASPFLTHFPHLSATRYEVSESEWKSIVLPVPSENINFSGLSVSAAATSTIIAESHLVQLVGGLDVSKLDINERAILLAQKRKQLVLLQRELSRVQRDIKAKQSICISSTSTTTHKHTAHTTTTTSLSQLTDMEVSKTSIASKSKKSSTFTKLLITNTPVSSLETTLPVNDEELARMLAKEEEERYLLEQGLLGEENGDHLEYDDDADDQDFTTRKKRGKSGGGGVSQGSSIKSKRAKIKSSS